MTTQVRTTWRGQGPDHTRAEGTDCKGKVDEPGDEQQSATNNEEQHRCRVSINLALNCSWTMVVTSRTKIR